MPKIKEDQKPHRKPIASKKALDGLVYKTHTEYECTSQTGEKQFQIFTEEGGRTTPHSTTAQPRLDSWKGSPIPLEEDRNYAKLSDPDNKAVGEVIEMFGADL
jgi:hypothetical protein